LIHSIAGELGLDVYVISLAKKGLDDSDLNNLMTELPKRCIALMEDIDVAFKGASKRSGIASSVDDDKEDDAKSGANDDGEDNSDSSRGVTLSGLLNALDGIAAQEGRILFATTNQLSALDEALCRPGRMDVHIEFKNASRWQAKQLFKCFFPPISKAVKDNDEDETVDAPLTPPKATSQFAVIPLTKDEAERLSEEFADIIPERMFSVASLQGLLLCHKNKPRDAVKAAVAFVQREKDKRTKTEKERDARNKMGNKSGDDNMSSGSGGEEGGKRRRRRRRNK